jgi:hypothetical protein
MKPVLLGIASVVATAAVLASTSDAHAAGHANGFGEKGQLIVSADRLVPLFSYTSASITRTENNFELTDSKSGASISLLLGRNVAIEESGASVPVNVHTIPRVAFDVTIIPRLTVGAAIAFGFGLGGTREDDNIVGGVKTTRERDEPTVTAIGLAPRVGYILPLADIFAFWPRAGIGIYSISGSREDETGGGAITRVKATDTLFSLDLDPQFALVPLEHFFIHAGPLVNIPLAGSRSVSTTTGATTNKRTDDASLFNLGLSAGLGGWFNVF